MKSSERNTEESIDQIIKDHLNKSHQENELSVHFNKVLMTKIRELKQIKEPIQVNATHSLAVPMVLLGMLMLLTFFYFYPEIISDMNLGLNFSMDLSFFQHTGIKYMLYGLSALIFFSVVDRMIQLKIQATGK